MSKFTHQKKTRTKRVTTGARSLHRSKIPARAKFLATAGVSLATGALSGADPAFGQKNEEIVPFFYHAPQSALDDLKQRLAQTRWPERETTNDWSEGVPLEKLRTLVDYWRTDYDWRRCEEALNRFPQFRTKIDGPGIHFIHVRSKHPNALPIILTHGWPSTILLFRDVIGPLTDPTAYGGKAEDAFDVIAPSLPGFGFSEKPAERGWNANRTAQAWATLMSRLGYKRYVAQGGDWGAFVTTAMAQQRAPGLAAIHLNFPQVIPERLPDKLSPDEQRAMEVLNRFRSESSGYLTMQATRPQTIGYALMDSPAGQAAWIYDLYNAGTGNLGNPEQAISQDKILDEITLYWLTGTAASSARFYYEQRALLGKRSNPGRVDLPAGVSLFRYDLPAPRSWAKNVYPNLFYWHQVDQGGHFVSLEKPALFVEELRTCFRKVRETDHPELIQ
jgi:pimeloyl-ACP methyl ester carboxylesterase